MSLRPTLVIGSVPYKQETVAKLLEHPVAFLAMNPRSLADVESDIYLLGGIVGRAAAARKLVARMRAEFQAIRVTGAKGDRASAKIHVREFIARRGRIRGLFRRRGWRSWWKLRAEKWWCPRANEFRMRMWLRRSRT